MAHAQLAISSMTTQIVTGTPSTTTQDGNSVTFDNNLDEVTAFTTTTGATYYANASSTIAIVDRDPTNDTYAANHYSQWYSYTGTSRSPTFQGVYESSPTSALLGNNLYEGASNLFVNDNGNTQSSGDVERVDFILSTAGESATSGQAFAVFDSDKATSHQTFKIAVVTAVDSNGNPTAYGGDLITVTSSDYDTTTNPVGNENYTVFRYDTGNTLSTSDSEVTGTSVLAANTGTAGIGGVALTMAELGITSGETIYGYSIMAADVYTTSTSAVAITTTISADLVNYNNTTVYPTDTSNNTTTGDGNYGGLNLADVNGIEFSTTEVTPEPAAYGAAFVGLSLLGAVWIRRRRSASLSGLRGA